MVQQVRPENLILVASRKFEWDGKKFVEVSCKRYDAPEDGHGPATPKTPSSDKESGTTST
jgi:hypothetical protein